MKTLSGRFSRRFLRGLSLATFLVLAVLPTARAGLNLEFNVIRYHANGYYFFPDLTTNNTVAPQVTSGDYYLYSASAPTNGSWAAYHFNTNGFYQFNGGSWGYGDFNGMMAQLTNGLWTLAITNTVVTNIYHFSVTSTLTSNSLPLVAITVPTNGAQNVAYQTTFAWQGPTNFSNLVVYQGPNNAVLPVTQTSWAGPAMNLGANSFTVHYDNYSPAVTSSPPLDAGSHPLAGWTNSTHMQDYVTSSFSVGAPDVSGTAHTLVAHFPWDTTNVDGSANGADTSGQGNNLDFSGSFGSQGGVLSTANAEAGPLAIQFENGDGNSAGYVGWQNTPTTVLTALAGSFSISCWVQTTQSWDNDSAPADQGAGIVSASLGGEGNYDVIPLALTGSKIGFGTGGNQYDTLNSATSVNDGNYHHVVVTRNEMTGQKVIYIDGVLDAFDAGSTNVLSDPLLATIGALSAATDSNPTNVTYSNGFNGELDDLQIYTGVLSANDVANLFNNPGNTVPDGGGNNGGHINVAHYTFDDTNTIFDLGDDFSGYGNNLDTYSYWGPTQAPSTNAVAGGAVQFFGTSCITAINQTLANLNTLLAGSFSFSGWVKTTATRGSDTDDAVNGATIFWAYNDHNNTNDAIPLAITGSKAAFTVRDHLGDSTTIHSVTSVNDGHYHFLAVTRNGGSGAMDLYVDGNLEGSATGPTDALSGNNYFISVGGTTLSSYTGLLDDLQIYSGVLSASDIAYLYANAGLTVSNVVGEDFAGALNTTNLTWSTGGSVPWFTETGVSQDGLAAQSGTIANDQSSFLQTIMPASGQISFYWKVSSATNEDYLTFSINGVEQTMMSGEVDWNQQTYPVNAGDVLN